MYAFVCMSACVHVYICMCLFVCMCAHVHMYICVHILYVCIRIYVSSVCSMYPSILMFIPHCQSYSRNKAFIAAQAPLESTKSDVWEMIWQYRPSTVVVLCDFQKERQVHFPLYISVLNSTYCCK